MDDHTLTAAQQLATALLTAQVEEARQRLLASNYAELAAAELDFVLAEAEEITLGEVVSRQSVKDVVKVFAFELDLGAGVMALSGEMAQQLHLNAQNYAPTVKELISNNSAAQWLDKVLELRDFREMALDKIGQSSTLHSFVADHALILIEQQIAQRSPEWLSGFTATLNAQPDDASRLTGRIKQGVRRRLSNTVLKQEELLDRTLRQAVAKTIEKICIDLSQLDDSVWRDALWQLWQVIRDEPISDFAQGLDPLDIEDFLVLGYDEWRKLRQTEYVQRLIYTGIDVFFNAYEETTLIELLADVGVTRSHMLKELTRFAPQVLQVLDERGYLRAVLTRQLSPFYERESTLALLHNALQSK
jgi:hypothetical protein